MRMYQPPMENLADTIRIIAFSLTGVLSTDRQITTVAKAKGILKKAVDDIGTLSFKERFALMAYMVEEGKKGKLSSADIAEVQFLLNQC